MRSDGLGPMGSMLQLDLSRVGRGTGPVQNRRVFSVLKSITMKEMLANGEGNPSLRDDFVSLYSGWIGGSTSQCSRYWTMKVIPRCSSVALTT